MDRIANEIINIDKETVKIKLKTEEIIEDKEKELKETLQSLEKEYSEEGRLESEVIYKKIVELGKIETDRLEFEDSKVLKDIENIYKGKKDKLIESLWNSLFISKE